MTETLTHNDVTEITEALTRAFRSFEGGQKIEDNPIAAALVDSPPSFAAGVDIAEVVRFIIVEIEIRAALAALTDGHDTE